MNYKEANVWGSQQLRQVNIEEADLDTWYLFEYVTGVTRAAYYAYPDRMMTESEEKRFKELIKKRAERIPLQHITGVQGFMGLTFSVNEHVLIPRQDTEVLVEEALELIRSKKIPIHSGKGTILDLCTGSGCILLSTLYYAGQDTYGKGISYSGIGSDLSSKALEVAKKNAKDLEIEAEFIQGDLFENVSGTFGLIVSNPPYIRTEEIERLQDEVRLHDPFSALDGKEDGLYFYRKIIKESPDYLDRGGWLVFEIGYDQAEAVSGLMRETGFEQVEVKKDLAGLDRIVYGMYSEKSIPSRG